MFKAFKKSLHAFKEAMQFKCNSQMYAEKYKGKRCLVWYGVFQIQGTVVGYNAKKDSIIIETETPLWLFVKENDVILQKKRNGTGYRYAKYDHINLDKEIIS